MERSGEDLADCGYREKNEITSNRVISYREIRCFERRHRGGYKCQKEDLEYMEGSTSRRH